MKVASKHDSELEGVFTDFAGGLDKSRPPFLIGDSFLYDITNFSYDPTTGYPTVRPGTKKFTSAPCPGSVIGGFELVIGGVAYTILGCEDGKAYVLDGALAPQEIGVLSGAGRPSFSSLNEKAAIATGGVLQVTDAVTLVNTASPSIGYISDHIKKDAAAIIGCADPVNKSRLHRSGVNDPTDWTTGTDLNSKYLDAGYKDGIDVIGIANFMGEVFTFKRSPNGGQRRIYRSNLGSAVADWYCKEVSRSRTTLSPHFIVEVGDVFFVDTTGPMRLSVVANNGDYPFTTAPWGSKIAGELAKFVQNDGFAFYDPYLRLIMIKPQKNSDTFYCGDPVTDRWTYFKFAKNIQCGFEASGKILLGASDGYLYEYDETLSQDDGTDFVKSIETKWFDYSFTLRNVLKEKYLSVIGQTAGSLTISIKVGGNVKYSKVLNFGEDWWSWARVNSVTPENWLEALTKLIGSIWYDKNPVNADRFSIAISVSSGRCSIGQLGGRIAVAGRGGASS